MTLKNTISKFKFINNKYKLILSVGTFYNIVWSIIKIIFGVISKSYYFSISGCSSLLLGIIKKLYLGYFNSDDENEKLWKSFTISILLILSSLLFTFYMARLFFVADNKEYGLIMSITIATFSFTELGFSIYNYIASKKSQDILLKSFRISSLAQSNFAIVLTQVALLSATNSTNSFLNGLVGVIFGIISIILGLYNLRKIITLLNITK